MSVILSSCCFEGMRAAVLVLSLLIFEVLVACMLGLVFLRTVIQFLLGFLMRCHIIGLFMFSVFQEGDFHCWIVVVRDGAHLTFLFILE